jgi:phosphoadenosine phosphosulfate reductase
MDAPMQTPQPTRAPEWGSERLAQLNGELENAALEAVLRWAVDTFAQDLALATSFGPQSIVLMHEIARVQPETTVFYLDTALLFPQTYALRDELARRLGLRFTRVATDLSVEQQSERFGPKLWARNPDLCCYLRKVQPLRRFLATRRAWITGIRNGQTAHRAAAPLVEWDGSNGVVKLNPLVRWSNEQVWEYLSRHRLPFNPLHREGYPSIGCQPCTRAVRPGEDARAGRWSGFQKKECGIHVTNGAVVRLADAKGQTP